MIMIIQNTTDGEYKTTFQISAYFKHFIWILCSYSNLDILKLEIMSDNRGFAAEMNYYFKYTNSRVVIAVNCCNC